MTPSMKVILGLTLFFFAYLFWENRMAVKNRRAVKHVVYVNGTRGKSSTTRLIDGGLRAAGLKVFCKTTGTLPMAIHTNGEERLIRRRGGANIREQLDILSQAAKEGAEVLVIECMAVNPVYQAVSQHRMVRADVGVITNVRLDHTDVMGDTLPQIAEALSNTVPRNGVLFTGEAGQFALLAQKAKGLHSEAFSVLPDCRMRRGGAESGELEGEAEEEAVLAAIDWPENVALALAVCEHLGISRETALQGMRTSYQRDPYALSLHRIGAGALFINGLSINDPQSTLTVYNSLRDRLGFGEGKIILLLNSRADRASRTMQMAELARDLAPDELWLLGAGRKLLRRTLPRRMKELPPVTLYSGAEELDFTKLGPKDVVFAAGNIALEGKKLMERVRKEGTPDVL